ILVSLLDHAQQVSEAPCRPAVVVRRFVGQDQVQALQELLQVDLKIGTRLDVLHRADSSMQNPYFCARVGKRPGHEGFDVGDCAGTKVLQEPLVALLQDRKLCEDALQALPDILSVFLRVDRERRAEVIRQPDVIDDETALFAGGHPIHSGNGLQEIMLVQALVNIHHLLNGRVKAGQQHVAHYQEDDPGQHLLRIVEIERFASLRASVICASSLVASEEMTTTAFKNAIRRISSASGFCLSRSRSSRSASASRMALWYRIAASLEWHTTCALNPSGRMLSM